MKPFVLGKHDWDKGKVTRRLDERSNEFQSHGATCRRNGQHLVKSPPAHTQHEVAKQTVLEPLPQAKQTVPDPLPQAQQSQRRQIASRKGYEQRYRPSGSKAIITCPYSPGMCHQRAS